MTRAMACLIPPVASGDVFLGTGAEKVDGLIQRVVLLLGYGQMVKGFGQWGML